MDIENYKKRFIELLRSTNREGVESVIAWLNQSDFFSAPASTNFHGNYPGGLLEHSANTYTAGTRLRDLYTNLRPEMADSLLEESVILVTLLHDVCKANVYKHTVKNQKINGIWQEVSGYTVDYNTLPLGHGEKSVIILLREGLKLTDAEMMAIRWHMGPWDLADSPEAYGNFNAARNCAPLCTLLQQADGLASAILEAK